MNDTIYNLLCQLIGTPTTEIGESALYIGAVLVTIFVLWSITSILLVLLRGAWSRL